MGFDDLPMPKTPEDTALNPGTESRPTRHSIDSLLWSNFARATGGLSPISLATAMFDWSAHMAVSPGHQKEVAWRAGQTALKTFADALDRKKAVSPVALTRIAFENFLHLADETAMTVPGVSRSHAEKVRFATRMALERLHPDNFFWTNEEAIKTTRDKAGANLVRGWMNILEDATNALAGRHENGAAEKLGKSLAVTPGRVVYRNRLIELIQYEPTTETVHAQPVLITPAWIMKYYILDLSAQKSLVSYLVDQGFTVFIISWRNPDQEDRDLSFDDYRRMGVLAALDAVSDIIPDTRIHTVGYCLGGTLLSIAAAALARDGDDRIASLTLLAAQTDFRDPGELSVFIDESQLELLDASMDAEGVLTADQMSGAFMVLRSRDLVWRRNQRAYLFGERHQLFDLMIWNNDTTRMPYRMHSEYLRRLFLNNDFVQGRFMVDNKPAAVSDIRAPIFALGTEKDHVAPWRSVFKIHLFADAEVTFALTNGGHNAGVVSEPGHPRRHHRILTKPDSEHYIAPEDWLERAEDREGSWWVSWAEWLAERSDGDRTAAKPKFADLESNLLDTPRRLPSAPGSYVLG